ncbi:DUF6107 family protein [Chelativorans xinjiangense]|uniref:DUF6107 family protein n=1 Tax=Chelativorans xinjiangense TaxID=2681485 RepID=UPI00135705E0
MKDQGMIGLSEAAWLWVAKAGGAIAGSAISLAYLLPTGRREAAIRFAVGVVCGVIFGSAAGLKIATELGLASKLAPGEVVLMGSAAASLCAWSAIGFVMRLFANAARRREARDAR